MGGPNIPIDSVRIDKGAKYAIGVKYAQRFRPNHIMFFDSDDYLSNRISQFLNNNKNATGWFSSQSFMYFDGQRYIYRIKKVTINLTGRQI